MSRSRIEVAPDGERRRLAYIPERFDLFRTKILRFGPPSDRTDILVASRDPGSGNALAPVVGELLKEDAQVTALVDGWAEDIFKKNLPAPTDVTPGDGVLSDDAQKKIGEPQVLLMDLSSGEFGLDTYLAANYPGVPRVVVEDYYGTGSFFISELKKRNLPLPDKICVMDQGAKELMSAKHPDIAERIVVTGQPAFDKIAREDTANVSAKVRADLGLKSDDKLLVYISTIDEPEKIREFASVLQNFRGATQGNLYIAFRRHPRDNNDYSVFKKIFDDAGVSVVDTNQFTPDQVGAAADVVLTPWSTDGLAAIYRRKPVINIIDPKYRLPLGLDLPLVPVKFGASVGVDCMADLVKVFPDLLDTHSQTNKNLLARMTAIYPADGQNAKRVAAVVKEFLKKTK